MQAPTEIQSNATPPTVSIKKYQTNHVGVFDHLRSPGDYKVLMAPSICELPALRCFSLDGPVFATVDEPGTRYEFPEVAITLVPASVVSKTGCVLAEGDKIILETVEGAPSDNFDLDTMAEAGRNDIERLVASSKFGCFNHAVFSLE